MKKVFSSVFLALFFLTAAFVMPASADSANATSNIAAVADDKKKDDKKKDPPGPVVVKDKDSSKGRDSDRPKKDKKPD